METSKPTAISRHHLQGRAAVYVRQSTVEQTRANTGSTAYQRGQVRWALAWGYPQDHIDVIDQDLGLSGSAADHRDGYLRLREGVERGIYKLVLVSDLTRLGRDADEAFSFIRSCKIHDVLIAIDGDVLDARHKYDLLRARLSAMFAELDRDNIRDTLERGRRARLEQGRAVSRPPAGYQARGGKWEFDSRPEVQAAIRKCGELFLRHRALAPTVAALREVGVTLPRARSGGDVEFVLAKVHSVRAILTNRAYMGDYVYGQYRSDLAAGRDRRGRVRSRKAAPDDVVVIRGHHDGYFSEETFAEFKHILESNAWTLTHGSVGNGEAVLQGLVRCEHCGFALSVNYRSRRADGHWSRVYRCIGELFEGGRACLGVPGRPLETVVERAVLAKIDPIAIEALGSAWEEALDAERGEEYRRKAELHRLRGQVADLEYRYLRADPENTYVLRAIETKLEDAKRTLERLEADQARHVPSVAGSIPTRSGG